MLLRFGPLRLRLHGSRRWLDLARQRYDGFVEESAPRSDSEIRVEYHSVGDGPSPRQVKESLLRPLEMTRITALGSAGSCAGMDVWHLGPGSDGLRISGTLDAGHIHLRGPLATFPLDSAMIALWSLACRTDAVVVHGALLAERDRGWLCTGPSGVGKSTLAGLLPERALCDELVGVQIETTADGPQVFAYGLPFWRGRPGRVRLVGLHFLAHAQHHKLHGLTPDRAFARLHSQILWPSWSEDALRGAFRVAGDLTELPCHVLAFRPDPGVWRTVSKHRLAQPLPPEVPTP